MKCAKCGREIDEARASAAIKLGDGRAALDWPCFEALLKPGRAAEVMRMLRAATVTARANGAAVPGPGDRTPKSNTPSPSVTIGADMSHVPDGVDIEA